MLECMHTARTNILSADQKEIEMDETTVEKIAEQMAEQVTKTTKRTKKGKIAKADYDRIVNGVGQSKCPACGKWVNGTKGSAGKLCMAHQSGLIKTHVITLDKVPANYVKIAAVHTACASREIPISRLILAFGKDKVTQRPLSPITYPICVTGDRNRYISDWTLKAEGLNAIKTGDFSKVPANVLKTVPPEALTAWENWK